jgi:hypothetical protein
MYYILEVDTNYYQIEEDTTLIIETADFSAPSGITADIFTAAGQLLGALGSANPSVIAAPTGEGYFLRARLAESLKMAWESVTIDTLTETAVKTAAYTAVNGDHVLVNASGAGADFEITLPASPNVGDKLRVTLVNGHATYKVTINRNSSLVNGVTSTGRCTMRYAGDSVYFVYTGATLGWLAIISSKLDNLKWSSETSSATPTINTDDVDMHSITALATAITSMTTNLSGTPRNGQKLIIRIKDNGTARAITWGASFESRGDTLPTTTVISKRMEVGLIYDSVAAKWGCVAVVREA